MASLSKIQSQVDQVRAILNDLQYNLSDLPPEVQRNIRSELEQSFLHLKDQTPNDSSRTTEDDPYAPALDRVVFKASASNDTENWLRHALKLSHVGAWKWDLVHNQTTWSPELYQLVRIDPFEESASPQAFIEMTHPDDRAEVTRRVESAIQQGGPFNMEFRIVAGDGSVLWMRTTGSVEHDRSGRPVQAAGITQDITTQKQLEKLLHNGEATYAKQLAEFKALMDAVPAMIWIARDSACREMVGNRYGYELLKMWEGANISKTAPHNDLSQQPYRNFKNGQEIPNEELPMQVAARTGVGQSNYEFDLLFNDGETKNLLGNVVPNFDAKGKPNGAVGAFVDITERKRNEEQLRKNEEQLRQWQQQLNIWSRATKSFIWVLSGNGFYQQPGPVNAFISGKTFEETRELQWLEVVHPEDKTYLQNQWHASIEHQTVMEAEARIWNEAARQYRWYQHRAVPIQENGSLIGWVGVSLDIQERKELEQALQVQEAALRASEAQERARSAELQAIIDAVPAPILLTRDPQGKQITGNLAAYAVFQAEPGSDLSPYLSGTAASPIRKILMDNREIRLEEIPLMVALRTGQPVKNFEGTVIFKDGEEVTLFGNATPFHTEAGETAGAVGVFIDITERQAAERALRISEHRFRVAIASAPIVVFTMDQDLRYTWVFNPRHNHTVDQMIGKRDDEINVPENVAELVAAKQQVITTGQPNQQQVKLKVGDAWCHYIMVLDPILDSAGQVTGLIGAGLDITQQQQLAESKQAIEVRMETQRQLLENRENERVVIAREIHDGPIQSLVAAIFNLEFVKENFEDTAVREELGTIKVSLKNAVQELREVVNHLRPPMLERFGLETAMRKYADDMHERVPELEIQFHFLGDLIGLPGPIVLALFRIFQEGLHNVIRHARATHSSVRLEAENDQVVMEIHDNGLGFIMNDLDHLTEQKHFGLAGMKERAEAVGGTIHFFSAPGEGTRVRVILPVE